VTCAPLDSRKLDSSGGHVDFYQLLLVPKDASSADVKAAYHRVLLQSHPDKRGTSSSANHIDIALIKEAYTVLSNKERRSVYDSHLKQQTYITTVPRPAQVVSLEQFEDESTGKVEEGDSEGGPWRYPCRCGGNYRITTALMDKGEHLIACNSCSEVVWVGYEIVES
jgi:diphthamide biosynthesis protein 4